MGAVDIRGRSHNLRINYRTSHQIRRHADRLLPNTISDERAHTISAFNGPDPTIKILKSEAEESQTVAAWLKQMQSANIHPHEIAIFVRSPAQLSRAYHAIKLSNLKYTNLDSEADGSVEKVSVGTMHTAKGLEFKAVAVIACGDEVIPLQERVESVADEPDLLEVYDSERYLLYVACTRARDHLLVTAVSPGSEFLVDMRLK